MSLEVQSNSREEKLILAVEGLKTDKIKVDIYQIIKCFDGKLYQVLVLNQAVKSRVKNVTEINVFI